MICEKMCCTSGCMVISNLVISLVPYFTLNGQGMLNKIIAHFSFCLNKGDLYKTAELCIHFACQGELSVFWIRLQNVKHQTDFNVKASKLSLNYQNIRDWKYIFVAHTSVNLISMVVTRAISNFSKNYTLYISRM